MNKRTDGLHDHCLHARTVLVGRVKSCPNDKRSENKPPPQSLKETVGTTFPRVPTEKSTEYSMTKKVFVWFTFQ